MGSTRFNLPSAKNARDRPSGDQKTDVAPSVPATGRASNADRARSKMRVAPAGAVATSASWDPSDERARNVLSGLRAKPEPTGGDTENRTEGSARLPREPTRRKANATDTTVTARNASATTAPVLVHGKVRIPADALALMTSGVRMPCSIHLSSSTKSRAVCQRASGSFARHLFKTRWSDGGARGCSALIGAGSASKIAAITLDWLFPTNARRPVTISYKTAPNANRSLRGSASRPSSCSGAMYCSVPTMVPCTVAVWTVTGVVMPPGPPVTSLASPKSSSFAPVFVSITFDGFKSRCTMPAWCARSSAPPISIAVVSARSSGNAPRCRRAVRVSPSRHSITK